MAWKVLIAYFSRRGETMKYLMTIAALMTTMACNGRKAATETLAASGEQTVQ